jgi:hypothetical protein
VEPNASFWGNSTKIVTYNNVSGKPTAMKFARILNVVAGVLFAVSLIIWLPLVIYLSIGFLVASIIYWRIVANKI